MSAPLISPFGDRAVIVDWPGEAYDEAANESALALAAHLRGLGRFTEVVPGYRSVVAQFDPIRLDLADAKGLVETELPRAPDTAPEGRMLDIPVRYGGEAGPDLAALAERAHLSGAELVERHCARAYRVCMMGFVPGFAFLSEVDEALRAPRHATPRAHVPAGSVGVAGWQTGIYGLDSPGGWQLLGRTDLALFDPRRDAPFLLEAGDRVRFVPQGSVS